MLQKIQSALVKRLSLDEPLLLGVSGGADSVALLYALVELGWRPHVCHLNHQWRGAESEADAEFVRELAGRLGLPCTVEARMVPHDEDAAREARHEFFGAVVKQAGIITLALAHTADDQAETFLLRLLRGAGTAGLSGIWPERQIAGLRVIRPLLEVSRAEVMAYLRERKLSWREDESNADVRFARNRLRHVLLPLLEREFNPGVRDVLARTAEILRDEDALLNELARGIAIETLADAPVALQRRALRLWLGELGFEHVEAVRALRHGELSLPGGVIVGCEHGRLVKIVPTEPVTGPWALNTDGDTVIEELGVRFVLGDGGERLDAEALGESLVVRTWREGDAFQPLGMTGTKKLQDFFVDEKVARRSRWRVPLVCVADGRIAWVVGYRIAEPFKVTERTRQVLRLRVELLPLAPVVTGSRPS